MRSLQLKLALILTLLSQVFLNACSPVADYKKPNISTPKFWKNLNRSNKQSKNNQENSRQDLGHNWWENFNDETLNNLVKTAISNNLDIKISYQKIAEARAGIDEKAAKLYPQINLDLSASRGNNFTNFINPKSKTPVNSFATGFDASWELDLFASSKMTKQAYQNIFAASNEAKNVALVSLVAEVIKNYFEFRDFEQEIILTRKSIFAQEKINQINQKRAEAGIISQIAVHINNIELAKQKTTLSMLEIEMGKSELAIEFLLNQQPWELYNKLHVTDFLESVIKQPKTDIKQENKTFLPVFTGDIFLDQPINIISKRPDIKAAEEKLKEATNLEGVAIAQIYPKISLLGFFGLQNNQSNQLLKSGSKAFSIAGGVSLPILNFGEIRSNIKIYNAKKEQALLEYQKTILTALQDIENTINNYQQQKEILEQLTLTSQESYTILSLQQDKYQKGLISLAQLLKVQIDFNQTQQNLVQSQTNFNKSIAALYKSIGQL